MIVTLRSTYTTGMTHLSILYEVLIGAKPFCYSVFIKYLSFYSPTDAQVNCLKNNFKIYITINITTAPACFGAFTPSSGSALLVIAKFTVVKMAS